MSFDEWLKQSTTQSGVPLQVVDAAVIAALVVLVSSSREPLNLTKVDVESVALPARPIRSLVLRVDDDFTGDEGDDISAPGDIS